MLKMESDMYRQNEEVIIMKTWNKNVYRKVLAVLLTAGMLMGSLLLGGCTVREKEEVSEGPAIYADIEIQDYGTITVALYPEKAPVTVENFVKLAEEGFYDGLTFHRIISGFMMQGGDPEGTGMGGSEEKIVGEFAANGHANDLSHKRGVISMARSQDYNSASSQFFIMHEDSASLDGQYAAFGRVTKGLSVVDAVCQAAQPVDNNGTIPAENQPVIVSVKIRRQ